MKALMLAAVMALGANGASALDTYELLSKGTVITLNESTGLTYFAYKGIIYSCGNLPDGFVCWKMKNNTVEE
jgi:hypothetical protein